MRERERERNDTAKSFEIDDAIHHLMTVFGLLVVWLLTDWLIWFVGLLR